MPDLITKREACDHLRVEYEVDSDGEYVTSSYDSWLSTWIPIVSESVLLWLKQEWRAYQPEIDSDGAVVLDSDGLPIPAEPLTPRHVVKAACMLELSNMDENRKGEGKDNVVPPDAGWGYVLNKTSTAMLAPLRKPTAA